MRSDRVQFLGQKNGFSGPRKRVSPPNKAILAKHAIMQVTGNDQTFNAAIIALLAVAARMPPLRPTSYRLLIELAKAMNAKTGHCYPSVTTLASRLKISAQAIRKARAELETVGLIVVETNGSDLQTNNYYLDFKALPPADLLRFACGTTSYPETNGAPSHINNIFGETSGAGWDDDDRELLEYARELERSND